MFTIGIVVFVGVIFAILLQLDRELWETQREMMRLPTEPGGTEYTAFTAFSQRSPVSLLIERAGPTNETKRLAGFPYPKKDIGVWFKESSRFRS